MSIIEQGQFLIAIGGVLLILKGIASGIIKMNTKLPEWAIKSIVGVAVIVIAFLLPNP